MRIMIAIVSWIVFFALAMKAGAWWSNDYSTLWGWTFWTTCLAFTIKQFMVSVPEVTGLLTVNLFTGKLRPYGPGMHFRFPWEQVKVGNYINLRLITDSREETYPAKDGPSMAVKWSFQYRPDVASLPLYIAVDETTINRGLIDVGSSVLSAFIAGRDAETCKIQQEQLERELRARFDGMSPTPQGLYGIELIRVSLADVDYEDRVQKARASEHIAERLRRIAAKIREEHPEILPKDALNAAMIINGDVTKSVTEVEGEGGQALAALLIAMAQGGGRGGKK